MHKHIGGRVHFIACSCSKPLVGRQWILISLTENLCFSTMAWESSARNSASSCSGTLLPFPLFYAYTRSLWNTLNRPSKSEKQRESSYLAVRFIQGTVPLAMAGLEHKSPHGMREREGAQLYTADLTSYVRIIPFWARGWVRPSLGMGTSVGRRTGTMPWECRNARERSTGMVGLPALTAWRLAAALPHTGFACLAGINIDTA